MADFVGCNWTYSGNAANVPVLELRNLGRPDGGQLYQAMESLSKGQQPGEIYTTTGGGGVGARIPFFNTTFASFSNDFEDTFSQISQRGTQQLLGNFAGALMDFKGMFSGLMNTVDGMIKTKGYTSETANGATGTYQEYPKFWQAQQNTDPVQCSFVMSNANGTGGNNLQTIKSFAAMCRPIKEGVNITPPCLFSLSITGGHRNLPVTYCSSFSVGMLGGRGGDGPEGYEINVAFQPLLIETADMWA